MAFSRAIKELLLKGYTKQKSLSFLFFMRPSKNQEITDSTAQK